MDAPNYPGLDPSTIAEADPIKAPISARVNDPEPTRAADAPAASRAVSSIELRVRYAETDQMGVVYHANYLVWCEIARTELIRGRFASYAEVERQGVLLAVSEASIRYHSAARYDDLIRVEAWVDEVRSRTVRFGYRIGRITDSGKVDRLATAWTTLIALNPESRPRKLPDELIRALADG